MLPLLSVGFDFQIKSHYGKVFKFPNCIRKFQLMTHKKLI